MQRRRTQELTVYDIVHRHLTALPFTQEPLDLFCLLSLLLFRRPLARYNYWTTLALSNNANQKLTHLLNKQQIYQTECTLHMKEFGKFYPDETQTPNWAFCFSVGWECISWVCKANKTQSKFRDETTENREGGWWY